MALRLLGVGPSEKEAAQRCERMGRIEGQGTTDNGDSAGLAATEQAAAAEGKRFATLRARLALAGYALSRSDAGDGSRLYFVTRWGLGRNLDSISAVEAFAGRVGVHHA